MNVQQLSQLLETHANAPLRFLLPSGEFVSDHFHVTEVGRVEKKFIDCGGTRREAVACVLQLWEAGDIDHRLSAAKLAKILKTAGAVLIQGDLPVEVEYGVDVASHYVVADAQTTSDGLVFVLNGKQTDCLAKDQCGVGACESTGCCS